MLYNSMVTPPTKFQATVINADVLREWVYGWGHQHGVYVVTARMSAKGELANVLCSPKLYTELL